MPTIGILHRSWKLIFCSIILEALRYIIFFIDRRFLPFNGFLKLFETNFLQFLDNYGRSRRLNREYEIGQVKWSYRLGGVLWKCNTTDSEIWLAYLFNRIINECQEGTRRLAAHHRGPIWKKTGNSVDNKRPIRLLSHTMKIFARLFDKRIRTLADLTINQATFVKGCSTTDAIHAARLLMEKYRAKKQPLHIIFLDLNQKNHMT